MVTNKAKAAANAEEKNRQKIAKKRARGLKKQEQKKKLAEKKVKKDRLILVLRRTGKGPEDSKLSKIRGSPKKPHPDKDAKKYQGKTPV